MEATHKQGELVLRLRLALKESNGAMQITPEKPGIFTVSPVQMQQNTLIQLVSAGQ